MRRSTSAWFGGAVIAALGVGLLGAGAARGQQVTDVPLTLGAPFTTFYWNSVYDYALQADPYGDDAVFTFTINSPTNLYIADGYSAGDEFEINVNGGPDLATSVTNVTDPNTYNPLYYIGDEYGAAFTAPEDAYFSHLILPLPAGSYSITGTVTAYTQVEYGIFAGYGAGGISLGAVPEPAAWALMLVGFGGIGAALRRRLRIGPTSRRP
jgi:hypothetical protein